MLCGHAIPPTHGVLDCSEPPKPEELEDDFFKYANLKASASRKESKAFHLEGTDLPPHSLNIITGQIPLDKILAEAKKYKVSLTEYLVGVYLYVLVNIQKSTGCKRPRPVKICVPVNMRRFYNSTTLRNFASYVNPGIDPRYGEYAFEEIVMLVHHYMRYETTEKHLNARLASNVKAERNLLMRIVPLFIKNWTLSLVYKFVGESRFTSTLSNLGAIDLPEEMKPHVEYFDFLLGPPRFNKIGCAVNSFGGLLCINFTRIIEETTAEREFFRFLVRSGIPVKIFSNQE